MASNHSAPHPQCYRPMPAVSNGILQGDLPFNYALPLLIMQTAIVLLVTRSLAVAFKLIKQPRVLAEIIGGVLLGPTALGRNKMYMELLFPSKSLTLLETVSTIGLMFFIFMVGLELDLQALRKTGKKALTLAIMGISVPFVACIGPVALVRTTIAKGVHMAPLLIFMGAPLSVSAFSVLVRIMAELKLLSTDIAKLAVPIGAINDVTIWTLLAVGVATGGGSKKNPLTPVWVILCAMGFAIFMCTVMRRFMRMIAHHATRETAQSTDLYVCVTLMGVLAAGFCSDAVGVHAILGPFLLGLVLPKDNPFPKMITEKIEDFVTGLFLPLFFALSGLKTNLGTLHGAQSLGLLVLFICTAAIGKISASFVTARLIGLPNRRALILGFLLNTKGLAVLIVLNIGQELKVLTDELFAILVLTALLTSFMTTPVVTALCRGGNFEQEESGMITTAAGGGGGSSSKRAAHRSLASLIEAGAAAASSSSSLVLLKKTSHHPQLRILACAFNESRDHGSFVNLLEASRGLKQSSLKLYPLKLSLLSERPSALFLLTPPPLFLHPSSTPLSFPSSPSLSKVTIHPLSTISDLDSMHTDICKLAAEKCAALILLPYHVPSTPIFADPSFSKVTQKVLDHAPCSVGLLVDRSSLGVSPIHPSFFSYKVVVLFVGGPDDREALFLGSRMIDHPGVSLKIVRFVSSNHHQAPLANNSLQAHNNNVYSYDEVDEQECSLPTLRVKEPSDADFEGAKERLLDDKAISKVKEKASESSYIYEEEPIASGQSLVEAVRALTKEMSEVNIFIIGRGRLRPKINAISSCDHEQTMHEQGEQLSELGVVGDALASSSGLEFHGCLLVIQQHVVTHKESKLDKNGKVVSRVDSFKDSQSPSFEISTQEA